MRKLLFLLLCLPICYCRAYTTSGSGPTTYTSDGSLSDTQSAVDHLAQGDILRIGAAAGVWTWASPLLIGSGVDTVTGATRLPKNLTIKGYGTGVLMSLAGGTEPETRLVGNVLDWTMANNGTTSVLSGINFNAASGTQVTIRGNNQYNAITNSGGIDFYDIRFTGSTSGNILQIYGCLTGVIWHMFVDHDISKQLAETIRIERQVALDGTGDKYGLDTYYQPYTAGGLSNQLVFEDCIFNRAPGGIDSNYGGIYTVRYSTVQGNNGGHGTRESTGNGTGLRALEAYNNRNSKTDPTMSAGGKNGAAHGIRAGEFTIFNERNEGATLNNPIVVYAYGVTENFKGKPWGQGPDGTSPWDVNHRGVAGTPETINGRSYTPVSTPSNAQEGSVYANGTGATQSGTVISGIPSPGGDPTDHWKGWTIRNVTATTRSGVTKAFYLWQDEGNATGTSYTYYGPPFAQITGSTSNTVTVQLAKDGGTTFSAAQGGDWEIVKVDKFAFVPGYGQIDTPLAISNNKMAVASGSPRWLNPQTPGGYQWNNLYRSGTTGSFGAITQLPVPSGYASVLPNMNNGPRTGYPYGDGSITGVASTNTVTRVGADWDANAITNDSTIVPGGPPYPHPLRSGIVASNPVVTGPATATFSTIAAAQTLTYSTTGFTSTPTLSASVTSVPSGATAGQLPAGLTFTSSSGTGTLSGAATGAVGGNYAVTITATAGGQSASTNLVLTVVVPTPPNCSLSVTQSSGVAPSDITLTAAATPTGSSAISTVEFYRRGVFIGSAVTPITPGRYRFVDAAVSSSGSYSYTAKAWDSNGLSTTSGAQTVILAPSSSGPTPTPPTVQSSP